MKTVELVFFECRRRASQRRERVMRGGPPPGPAVGHEDDESPGTASIEMDIFRKLTGLRLQDIYNHCCGAAGPSAHRR